MSAANFDPGTMFEMSRLKPDGVLLSWRLSTGGDTGPARQGALPFAIDWGGSPSPAASLPSMGALKSVAVSHPDAATRASAKALNLGVEVSDGPAGIVITVETANGTVEIR